MVWNTKLLGLRRFKKKITQNRDLGIFKPRSSVALAKEDEEASAAVAMCGQVSTKARKISKIQFSDKNNFVSQDQFDSSITTSF